MLSWYYAVPKRFLLSPLLLSLFTMQLGPVLHNNYQSLRYPWCRCQMVCIVTRLCSRCPQPLKTCNRLYGSGHKLCLNPSRTKFLLNWTLYSNLKFQWFKFLKLDDSYVELAGVACNLSRLPIVFFILLVSDWLPYTNGILKSSYTYIRDIRSTKRYAPMSSLTLLVNALVSCRVDYCKSLHFSITKSNMLSKDLRV